MSGAGYEVFALFQVALLACLAAGGVLGALIQGFKRAAFSNEAGIGSAAIVAALLYASKVKKSKVKPATPRRDDD